LERLRLTLEPAGTNAQEDIVGGMKRGFGAVGLPKGLANAQREVRRATAARPAHAPSSLSRGGSELEEWVTPSLGDVLLDRLIDADPIAPEQGDGWPHT
jgi:hypothetical protein